MTPNPNIAKCKACGGDGDAKSGPAEGTLCRACGGSGYAWPTIDEAKKRATQLIKNGLPDCRPSQPVEEKLEPLSADDELLIERGLTKLLRVDIAKLEARVVELEGALKKLDGSLQNFEAHWPEIAALTPAKKDP